MHYLVRVVEKDGVKTVQLYLGHFNAIEDLEKRKPDKKAPAGDHVELHRRLNDSSLEAERYFERLEKTP